MPIIFTILTFFSTLCGGLFALKYRQKIHLVLGFTAGVMVAVVAFDIFPEIFERVMHFSINPEQPMIALIVGFLLFHIMEKSVLIHHSHEEGYAVHKHPTVGALSALALSAHSFLDGVGIGLGFQASPSVGILVAIAVISHDFADGLNTVTLVITNHSSRKRAFRFLLLDAGAPILGVLSTLLFHISDTALVLYLGFFAGFLLYIGSSDILPEAHSGKASSYKTILMTILGVGFIFLVTRVI